MENKITDETTLDCGHKPSKHQSFTTGYGVNAEGKTACYDCCARVEEKNMKDSGRAVLYLVNNDSEVTDWPGHLRFKISHKRTGRHNWGIKRIDIWFNFGNETWHGVHYGDNNDLVYCKRTKGD